MEDYTRLWAKTGSDDRIHPVVCHLLDTAAVCRRLLDCLPPAAVQRLQQGLGLDESGLRTWVPFLAGAHDTGKAAPPFQFKPGTSAFAAAQRLEGGVLYANWRELKLEETPHGIVTACTLPEYLQTHGMDAEVAQELAVIVGGHHGTFPSLLDLEDIAPKTRRNRAALGLDASLPQWRAWRKQILDTLADYCEVTGCPPPDTIEDPGAAVLLAGITTVSDWIASNAACFPYAGAEPDLAVYTAGLDQQAQEALRQTGWLPWQPHNEPLAFDKLFPFPARGLQTSIEQWMPRLRGEAALIIVEAPTGEGKTEAALTVAHWNSVSGMPGSYIGMPTQATGNALYERLRGYLDGWYPGQRINLQLVHSAARLDESFSETICRLDEVYDDEKEPGGVAAGEWFVHRKRALLAPWGVGTADQALVGVLRRRHQFLRLLGLAGKTVILDEVHAYDSYTSRLVDRLVHWCAIVGSPVVILSATLSQDQRRRLVASYAMGLGCPEPEIAPQVYPRLTIYSREQTAVETFEVDKLNRERRIRLCWIGEEEMSSLLGRGPTAVIRSSVGRCQAIAQKYPEARVFHSRFTQADRSRIEDECRRVYGKPTHREEPTRAPSLLVATQVIEQSLDVDFDVLISDPCPIDLLIQRIGRLWRHDRVHRGVKEPVLYLIRPDEDANGLPNFGVDIESRAGRHGYQKRVYDRHALLRTWYLLRHREELLLPTEIDVLIEAAYNLENRTTAEGLNDAQSQDWQESLGAYWGWTRGLADLAGVMVIPERHKYCGAWELTHARLDDGGGQDAYTRLIDDSLSMIVDAGEDAIDPARKPVGEEIRSLLRCQVRLSSPGLVHTLRAELAKGGALRYPQAWKHAAYLRELPLLTLPAYVGSYRLSYDHRLGLLADKL